MASACSQAHGLQAQTSKAEHKGPVKFSSNNKETHAAMEGGDVVEVTRRREASRVAGAAAVRTRAAVIAYELRALCHELLDHKLHAVLRTEEHDLLGDAERGLRASTQSFVVTSESDCASAVIASASIVTRAVCH
jgi:selenocysteine lyase/cysteine desulfurase